jgi:hypothetical protein
MRLALLWLAFWGLRAPWIAQPLVGEEGTFSQVYSERPRGPDYQWLARVKGRDVYTIFEHPPMLYEAMRGAGALAERLGWPAPQTPPARVAWVRILNAAFQLAFWTILACLVPAGAAATAGLLVVQAWPLAVGASLYLQTDTTSGVFLAGLLGMMLALGRRRGAFFAAFLLGLVGKQEWGICLFAALGAAALLGRRDGRTWLRWAPGLAALCVAGALCARAYDPLNWDGGLNVLGRVGVGHNVIAQRGAVGDWIRLIKQRAVWFFPLFAALGALALGAWPRGRSRGGDRALGRKLAVLWAWCLALPFLASTWGNEFRYLAPAGGAAAAALVAWLSDRPVPWSRGLALVCSAALLCGVGLTAWAGRGGRSITENPGLDLRSLDTQRAELFSARDCVPEVDSGTAWMYPGHDFVGAALGQNGAAVVEQAGGVPCRVPLTPGSRPPGSGP